MKKTSMMLLMLAGALLGCWSVSAQPPAGLEQGLVYLSTYDFGQSRTPLNVVVTAIRASDKDAALKEMLVARFSEILKSNAPIEAKNFICRQFVTLGSAGAVPALVAQLSVPEVADAAIWALGTMPAPEAAAALRDALGSAPDTAKVAVIDALGARRDAQAGPALAALLGQADKAVQAAAVAALGKIADDAATGVLHGARANAAPEMVAAIDDALLNCASAEIRAGKIAEGVALYKELNSANEPSQVRAAALSGLIKSEPKEALNYVLAGLQDAEPDLFDVAAMYVRDAQAVAGPEATRAVVKVMAKAAVDRKAALLAALADRHDIQASGAVRDAANDDNEQVKLAGLKALGRVGDVSCVEVLLNDAASGSADAKRAARTSLGTIPGANVNEHLMKAARHGAPETRCEALRALADRRGKEARAEIFKLLSEQDASVRTEAVRALQALTDGDDVPNLIALVEAAKDDSARGDIENILVAAAQRIVKAEDRTAAVCEKLAQSQSSDVRAAMVRVIGNIGTPKSLEVLRAALQDGDAKVRAAALGKVGTWPNDAPLDDLKAVAAAPKSDEERGPAVEAYLRVLRQAATRPADDRLARYAEALAWLKNAGEKRAALGGLSELPTPAALDLIEKFRGDAEVGGEVDLATLKVAQLIAGVYPDRAKAIAEPFQAETAPEPLRKIALTIAKALGAFQDYITAWQVAGPYSEKGKNAPEIFDQAFPPEKGEAVAWQIMPMGVNPNAQAPFVTDLLRTLDARECVAYLRTEVTSPKAQEALLEVGSNDGVKVWLNGQVVDAVNVGRAITPDEDKIKVQLKEGANSLLVASYQQGGEWGVCARFRAPDGAPLEGVTAGLPK
jgi:HEAT repeat protein